MLDHFLTAFFDHPDNALAAFFKKFSFLAAEVERRSFRELPIDKFRSRPWPELLRSLAARAAPTNVTDYIWEWAELGFDRWAASELKRWSPDAVHTYEHAALATLKQAKTLGIFSIYEQPSQHHTFFTDVARAQLARYPELRGAESELLVNAKAAKRNMRRDDELALASLVLCNSAFTRRTLVLGGVDEAKILTVPLGFPDVAAGAKESGSEGPLIFVNAGSQSLRKGSHILYRAWRECAFPPEKAELWIAGKMFLPEELRRDLPGKVVLFDNLPHAEVMELYRRADVFVLPTLADGFGMVVTESMSQGTAVIATENCCGPDVIRPMQDGWIVPAGDPAALAAQLRWCVAHPAAVREAGQAARAAATRWPWPAYRQAVATNIAQKWREHRE